jgi:protease-4
MDQQPQKDVGLPGDTYSAYPRGAAAEGRPVSFYLAIFLAMLLLVSGGLNLVLLFFGALRSATDGLVAFDQDDSRYEVVAVGGAADARKKVLRVPIHGAIAEDAAPLLGATGGSVSAVERALRLARRDADVAGVVLDIDSPGGGVTDSDAIHRLIGEFRQETSKPVVALLGDVAASGGYYAAVACDRIVAQPTTITGSIGVIISAWNYSEAAKEIGIQEVTVVSDRTPYKDMLSGSKPVDGREIAIVKSIVDEMYDRFVDVVDEGRSNLSRDQVQAAADGRIYSASQAHQLGLVDAIGSEADALEMVRTMAGVGPVKVVEQRRRANLFDMLMGTAAARVPLSSATELLRSVSGPRLLYFWPGGR